MILSVNDFIIFVQCDGTQFEGSVVGQTHHYPNFRANTMTELAKQAELIVAGIKKGNEEIEQKKKTRSKK